MSDDRIISPREFDFGFSFTSYGVTVGLACDDRALLETLRGLVAKAFGDRARIFEGASANRERSFGVANEGGLFRLYRNGFAITSGPSEKIFFRALNSRLRLEVAGAVDGRVFVHAGVVGWNGQAIVFPGMSHTGKSTLAAELIKHGAVYYSDEYAVLEKNGFVSPFPRHLSLRNPEATEEHEVRPEELGAKIGRNPIPIGMVLVTSFADGASWKPEVLSAGSGIMELIPNTLTMHRDPGFALKVLDLVARRAIIVRSPRGDVKKFAKFLLAFFDKHSKLAKMT